MSESCYFFLDDNPNVKYENKTMKILCIECYNKNPIESAWFYDSKEGYGPFDFQCNICNKIIHKGSDE